MTEEPFKELVGNRAVEDAAIAFVLAHERRHGRTAHDTRHQGAPADVQSDDLLIELKAYGRSARGQDLWLEVRQVEEARSNPDFHIYVVDNVRQGDPAEFRLIDLHGDTLAHLLVRAKEQRYYSLPFPVALYDQVRAADRQPKPQSLADTAPPPSGDGPSSTEDVRTMPRTSAVEWVLTQGQQAMRPVEIWAQLTRLGRHDAKADVSVTTYDLWQGGRIAKEGRGLYRAAFVAGREGSTPDYPGGLGNVETVFTLHGYTINLDILYRAMYQHSVVGTDGKRTFNGNSKNVPAVKRLLYDLFAVPVSDKIHPVNNAIRSEVRDRLDALGWATKDAGRSGRYVLHRDL